MEKLKQNGYVRSVNQPNGILIGNWYPKHRPLQIYRKQGNTTDNTGNLADTYWIFNGINIHVVFGTFWYEGYGYVAVQSNPTSFAIGFTTYTFVSNDSREVVWRTSDNIFVSWMSSANNEIPCEPKPVYVKQYKLLGKKTPDHNSKFATQGAVTSAERLLRLKTESKVVRTTITGKKLI